MISSFRTGDFQNTGQALSAHRYIQTAMLNGLKPYNYLTYVMGQMKDLGPFPEKEAMLELLPWSTSLPADCHSKLKK